MIVVWNIACGKEVCVVDGENNIIIYHLVK